MKDKNKFILDACCGPKYMWFNKNHPNSLFMDNRRENFLNRKEMVKISPDFIGDFRDVNFPNKSFKLIVWDPPHLKMKKMTGNFAKTFGNLHPDTWQDDLKNGFNNLWRMLDDFGVLIFKFSDFSFSFKEVLKLFPVEPLFGNTASKSKNSVTKWFCFMKIPKHANSPTSPNGDFSKEKEHNISLKESSAEDSQISSNDETSLNNNIKRNIKKSLLVTE